MSASRGDIWDAVETASLAAFGPAVSQSHGITTSLRRAGRYAVVDSSAHEIVVDRLAVLLGLVAAGLAQGPSPANDTASWLVQFLSERVGRESLEKTLAMAESGSIEANRGGTRLISAFSSQAKVVASRLIHGLLPAAVDYAQ